MKTFKAYFKKEMLEAVRNYKYLILFSGIVFWAIMNPLMIKLMPLLLRNWLPADLTALFSEYTIDAAFMDFMGDVFELGTLFIAFSLMGLISNEVYYKKLAFPYSRGAEPAGLVLSKYIHYMLVISLFILTAFLTNYFYVTRFFEGGILTIGTVFKSALLYMIYYSLMLSFLVFLSSLFRRSLSVGFSVAVLAYSLSIFNRFNVIRAYFPNYLLYKAADIGHVFDDSLIPIFIISFCLIILLIFFSILRMRKIDIV
jgi:ABC-2 type transport system permease protein